MTQPKDPQELRQFWINEVEGLSSTAEESIKNGCYTHVIEYSAYQALQSKLEKAEAENKMLRGTLEYYANMENWETNGYFHRNRIVEDFSNDHTGDSEIICGGKRARQALKGEEK